MKIIVIGAAGTIGVEVAKALSASKHEVIRASRNGEVKVNLEDTASIRAMFDKIQDVDAVISCAGNATFRPFAVSPKLTCRLSPEFMNRSLALGV